MLADDLRVDVQIDLLELFEDLGSSFLDADFGDVRFDASGVLGLVTQAGLPDLAGVLSTVSSISGRLDLGSVGLPGGDLAGIVDQLTSRLGMLGGNLIPLDTSATIGLDGLAVRFGTIQAAVAEGPLPALLGLVPGVDLSAVLGRFGGSFGGVIDGIRVLAALTASAAISQRLVARAELLSRHLDGPAAITLGQTLGRHASDNNLVNAIRTADPEDLEAVTLLAGRVQLFLDATFALHDRWSLGMGFGEATLVGLDLEESAGGLELARLTLAGVDLDSTATVVADFRQLIAPLIDVALPVPEGATGGVIDEALNLVATLLEGVLSFDPATLAAPVTRMADSALATFDEIRRVLETISTTAAGAIRAGRDLIAQVDLSQVADSLRRAMQPVVDTLDAIDRAIGDAQVVIIDVATAITDTLGDVLKAVQATAKTVSDALDVVNGTLAALGLQTLADTLSEGLGAVSDALASAELTPYFDTAIDVIDTGASIIEAVPFGMLPTDVQQEIVDVCRPIKQLDLTSIEDTLRAELTEIRTSFRADALAAIEEAYAAVVEFLVSLDPQPHLAALEAGPMAALREALAGIDPVALLQPVTDALSSFQALLDDFDLETLVLVPLDEVFVPVHDAVAGLNPIALLEPVAEQLESVRTTLTGAIQIDTARAGLTGWRDSAVATLGRLDPDALARAIDSGVASALAALPAGPPGGPFGSLLVSLAQATGLDADEGAVADVISWIGGHTNAAEVVQGRLAIVAGRLAESQATLRLLDPAPLAAAAQAQHRALLGAVSVHPPGSVLRLQLDGMLAGAGGPGGMTPGAVLTGLIENRRRYMARLDTDTALAQALAASGRSELAHAAAGMRRAISPLDALPAKVRSVLGALGIDSADEPFGQLVRHLIEVAGPARVLPALSVLATAARDKVIGTLDALLAPALGALDSVQGIIDSLDITPIVDELTGLHADVLAEIDAFSPRTLLGDSVGAVDAVVGRLRTFDPLAPVRDVIDDALAVADQVLETARPTVAFAGVVELHGNVVNIATGLDVAALLRPVLDSLDSLAGQLDDGFDRTGDSLVRLQDALPGEVSSNSSGVSGSISVGLG